MSCPGCTAAFEAIEAHHAFAASELPPCTCRPAWTCWAKPAALAGRTCGHENKTGGVRYAGLVCCESCGATKIASDARAPKA